jgi:hypothetical protein
LKVAQGEKYMTSRRVTILTEEDLSHLEHRTGKRGHHAFHMLQELSIVKSIFGENIFRNEGGNKDILK